MPEGDRMSAKAACVQTLFVAAPFFSHTHGATTALQLSTRAASSVSCAARVGWHPLWRCRRGAAVTGWPFCWSHATPRRALHVSGPVLLRMHGAPLSEWL